MENGPLMRMVCTMASLWPMMRDQDQSPGDGFQARLAHAAQHDPGAGGVEQEQGRRRESRLQAWMTPRMMTQGYTTRTMFDRSHLQSLRRPQVAVRPRPSDRGQYRRHGARGAPGAARCRRRAPRGQDLHRRGQGARRRRRSHQEPHARAGLHQGRARGADAAHGRAEHRPQPARAAPGGRDAGRPAGRRQDHQRRQARALADREAEQEGADGQHRRVPSGRHPAAADAGGAGGRGICAGACQRSAGGHRQARAHRGDAAGLRRAAARHRRPPAHRCRDDGGGAASSKRPSSRTSACSSSTAWPARTRSTPPRHSTTR